MPGPWTSRLTFLSSPSWYRKWEASAPSFPPRRSYVLRMYVRAPIRRYGQRSHWRYASSPTGTTGGSDAGQKQSEERRAEREEKNVKNKCCRGSMGFIKAGKFAVSREHSNQADG